MNLQNKLRLICPDCRSDLRYEKSQIVCGSCKLVFPIIAGIPDMRIPQKPLNARDLEMLALFEKADFAQLLEVLLKNVQLTQSVIRDTYAYYKNQVERSEKMSSMFLTSLAGSFNFPDKTRALDIGCGSGAALLALKRRFDLVIGIDASFSQLLLAKKLLSEENSQDTTLICANANQLPFEAAQFSYIQAVNVLEHLIFLEKPLQEIKRCLVRGGLFAADSRNRFDIFMPEPHTGVRLLGFLPRSWIPGFTRMFCNSDYESTWLWSYRELHTQLKKIFPQKYHIIFPDVTAYGQPAWAKRILSTMQKLPGIRQLLMQFFSVHLVLASKTEER